MHQVTLSLGSNTVCSAANVAAAVRWLRGILRDAVFSSLYMTPEIHGKGNPYTNAVAIGNTVLALEELNAMLKEYELRCGRNADARALGIVPVDIDIVVWDGDVVRPRDYACGFFRRGFSELTGPAVEQEAYGEIDRIGNPHGHERGGEP